MRQARISHEVDQIQEKAGQGGGIAGKIKEIRQGQAAGRRKNGRGVCRRKASKEEARREGYVR
jgi:hypothetical protein